MSSVAASALHPLEPSRSRRPRLQALEVPARPLGHHAHAPVAEVGHGPVETERHRLAQREHAVAHTLDPAANSRVESDPPAGSRTRMGIPGHAAASACGHRISYMRAFPLGHYPFDSGLAGNLLNPAGIDWATWSIYNRTLAYNGKPLHAQAPLPAVAPVSGQLRALVARWTLRAGGRTYISHHSLLRY